MKQYSSFYKENPAILHKMSDMKDVILRAISQVLKEKYSIISIIYGILRSNV